MRDELLCRWDDMLEGVRNLKFSLEEFKTLFVDTWKYFGEVAKGEFVARYDVAILCKMSEVLGTDHYPSKIKPWEYDAVTTFLHGLVYSVCACRYPISKYIEIQFEGHHWTRIPFDEFEELFQREYEDLKHNRYCDGEDYEDEE